jgi:N-acetylglucosaminyldiphosphoundecaprenol N-acetyl-beta-D-mannosaminyltransferase
MASFLGLRLDALDMAETLDACEKLIAKRNTQHVVLNAAKVVHASDNAQLTRIINGCDLVNADGMSVVWAARALGLKIRERVAGIDLMHNLVDLSQARRYSIYLVGATQRNLDITSKNFIERGANVVGSRNGYWQQSDELEIVRQIADKAPDILFLAIPSPQKEFFLSKHLENLNVGLAVGVGGSFDIVAGETKRAPLLMQKAGLEWVFRLAQEPRRMFKRYFVGNLRFVILVISELLMKTSKSRRSKP